MKIKITPLSNNLLVIPLPPPRTENGLFVSDLNYHFGKVTATGPGRYENGVLVPVAVAIGQTILFRGDRYDTYRIQDELLINESDLLGVVQED